MGKSKEKSDLTIDPNELEWYLPDKEGIMAVGPFTTLEIENNLINKKLSLDDFISCPKLTGDQWMRTYNYPHFENLMKKTPICPAPRLLDKGINHLKNHVKGINIEGRKIEADVILHNNTQILKGKTLFISTEILKVIITSIDCPKNIINGSIFNVTLFNCSKIKSFTAYSVVTEVSNFSDIKLYFIRINPEIKQLILQMEMEE